MNVRLAHIRLATIVCAALLMIAASVHANENDPLLNEISLPAETLLEELVANSNPLLAMEGFASYYASRLIGKRTASGHRYHPEKLTAAHPVLPMGTVVRVVNPVTSQEVQVTINDRCASKPFNFIDLSRAAAKKIGLWGKGRIKVVIIPLRNEPLQEPA